MIIEDTYDVIVVGGGHAGCEAANAAAKLGQYVVRHLYKEYFYLLCQ